MIGWMKRWLTRRKAARERLELMKQIRTAKYTGMAYRLEMEREGSEAWLRARKIQLKHGYKPSKSK